MWNPPECYRGEDVTLRGPQSLESLRASAADGLPERGAVEIFAQVHEGEECIEDAGLHFVRQVQAAGGRAGEHFAVFGNVADNLYLARVGSLAIYGFATHFRTGLFDLQSEVEDAQMHGF